MFHTLIALLPVVVFLLLMILLDSFKLVKPGYILLSVVWGAVSAAAAYYTNTFLMSRLDVGVTFFSKYMSPFVEETLKMLLILWLIKTNRIGFMIDGAIYGFAIGTGFALVENFYYLYHVDSGNMALWMVRGFGTAIMHGGTTSILSIIIMLAVEQQRSIFMPFVTGLILALIIHSAFNHFILPPVMMMITILLVVILIEFLVFRFGERSLRKWLEMEFDSEVNLLAHIRKGKFIRTRSGKYLLSIKDRFSKLVVVDLMAYISLYLELSIKAKSRLMVHEAGLSLPPDPEMPNRLNELKALEKAVGKTALLAISPILRITRKDLWKWSLLK